MWRPSKLRAFPSHTPDRPLTDSGQALDGWRDRSSSGPARSSKPVRADGRSGMRPDSYLVQKQGRAVIFTDGKSLTSLDEILDRS